MVKEAKENQLKTKDLKRRLEGTELDLSLLQIEKVPVTEIASLNKVTSLDLSCNLIVCLPDNFSTVLQNLIKLDLSKNKLTKLPGDIGKLKHLQRLDLFQNSLVEIPVSFAQLSNLKWLDLKDNPLDSSYNRIVGDCLDDKQCRQCAKNVVSAKQAAAAKYKEQRLNMLKEQKESEANKKAQEKKFLERKRREKKLEKERRRKEWESRREQCNGGEDEVKEANSHDDDPTSAPCDAVHKHKGGSRYWCLALLVAVAASCLYCYARAPHACRVFNAKGMEECLKVVEGFFAKLIYNGEEYALHLKTWLTRMLHLMQEYYHNTTTKS